MNKISSVFLFLFAGILVCSGIDLVRDGAVRACIVQSSRPGAVERFASEELQKHVRAITGAVLPIVQEPAAGLLPIRFGTVRSEHLRRRPVLNQAISRIRHDGFLVDAGPEGLQIISVQPAGIHYGNYYLLKKYGGIYWFHPDAEACIPRSATLSIPDQLTVRNPMKDRPGIPPGSSVTVTPEIRERCALWNIRNGFQLNQYPPGSDPDQIRPGNDYKNATIIRLGGTPSFRWAPGVGELISRTPVDPEALKQEMARVRREDKSLFNRLTGEAVREYAKFKLISSRHPEFYGLVDGRRVPAGIVLRTGHAFKGKCSMPCLSNPATREQLLQNILSWKRQYCPDAPMEFTVGCDDHSQWCECPECRKLLKGTGPRSAGDKASDYWWDFINDFSERLLKYPDITLQVYAYRDYQAFPEKVRPVPRSNMSIRYAYHGRCYLHHLNDPACPLNRKFIGGLKQWLTLGLPLCTFEYMSQTPGKSNYAFWERAWITDIKFFMKNNISVRVGGVGPWTGYYSDESYYRQNAAKSRWQIAWLTGYFMWNPEDDFDAVRDRMFRHYYGKAWKYMKPYRELLENALLQTGLCMGYGGGGNLFAASYAVPGLARQVKQLFRQAEQAAGSDTELRRRIAMDKKYYLANWASSGISSTNAAITRIPAAGQAVKMDGRLDEKCWIQAPVLDPLHMALPSRDTMMKSTDLYAPDTQIRLLYDEANLYLGITARKIDGLVRDLPADGTTFQAMKGSHLEFQIMSPALKGRYYHLALSHNGLVYSALTDSGKLRDLTQKIDFEFKIADQKDCWTAEVRIPAQPFGGIRQDDLWKIEIARFAENPGKPGRYGTLSGYSLHCPDYWPVIAFGNGGNLLQNGSFEDTVPREKLQKDNGRKWTFAENRVPRNWFFQANGGQAEIRTDGAADGQTYLRIAGPSLGWPAFMLQELNAFDPDATHLKLTMKIRGRGNVIARLLKNKDRDLEFKIHSPQEWTTVSGSFKLKTPSPGRLMIRTQGSVDYDDIRLTPEISPAPGL